MGHPDLHFSSFQTIPIGHSYAKVNVELIKKHGYRFFHESPVMYFGSFGV